MGVQTLHRSVASHWVLRLTRHEDDDAWSWDLSYLRDGEQLAFATKRMVRLSG